MTKLATPALKCDGRRSFIAFTHFKPLLIYHHYQNSKSSYRIRTRIKMLGLLVSGVESILQVCRRGANGHLYQVGKGAVDTSVGHSKQPCMRLDGSSPCKNIAPVSFLRLFISPSETNLKHALPRQSLYQRYPEPNMWPQAPQGCVMLPPKRV